MTAKLFTGVREWALLASEATAGWALAERSSTLERRPLQLITAAPPSRADGARGDRTRDGGYLTLQNSKCASQFMNLNFETFCGSIVCIKSLLKKMNHLNVV